MIQVVSIFPSCKSWPLSAINDRLSSPHPEICKGPMWLACTSVQVYASGIQICYCTVLFIQVKENSCAGERCSILTGASSHNITVQKSHTHKLQTQPALTCAKISVSSYATTASSSLGVYHPSETRVARLALDNLAFLRAPLF